MQSWVGVSRSRSRNRNFGPAIALALGTLCLLAASATAVAADKKDDKPVPAPTQMVDSGSFGVFMHGQRVATETFSIQQSGSGSSVVSRFKSDAGADKAEQTSEWQMGPGGELRKYEWKELIPGQSQAVVVASQDFLIERFKSGPQAKEQEQPFMLPATSSLLDDYFFVQREVLAWKYLATSCKQENGALQCPLKQRVPFGALNAHARSSVSVTIEFVGKEKVTIRGVEHELNRLDLNGESGNWALWFDDQFKLQRILIASEYTEVVRD
jgi:hypothetical protein